MFYKIALVLGKNTKTSNFYIDNNQMDLKGTTLMWKFTKHFA